MGIVIGTCMPDASDIEPPSSTNLSIAENLTTHRQRIYYGKHIFYV
jgi:hypothetical protein